MIMKLNENPTHYEETILTLINLNTPLTNEDVNCFIDELPDGFDFVNDYENLKNFIYAKNFKNLRQGEMPVELMLFIKEQILKIPSASNNPLANIVINQAVFGCFIIAGYLSASELLLQLTKWIVRLKKQKSKISD